MTIPSWIKLVLQFLWALIPSGISSYIDEKKRQGGFVNKGAADQRRADDAADDEITAEARGRKEQGDALSDEDARHRLDRWRRP